MKLVNSLKRLLYAVDNPEILRNNWILEQLKTIKPEKTILDAGCGSQPYKMYCKHLKYHAQDFAKYDGQGSGKGLQNGDSWNYGQLNYTGNIWEIEEKDCYFDVILCTEVFEHIPYPNETIKEFSRLLKSGGEIILTAPYACLPHMQPYFFYSGFSEDYYQYMAKEHGLIIEEITQSGNTFDLLFIELKRSYELLTSTPHKALFLIMFIFAAPFIKLLAKLYNGKSPLHLGYFVKLRKV